MQIGSEDLGLLGESRVQHSLPPAQEGSTHFRVTVFTHSQQLQQSPHAGPMLPPVPPRPGCWMPAFPKASSILMSHSDMDLNTDTMVTTWVLPLPRVRSSFLGTEVSIAAERNGRLLSGLRDRPGKKMGRAKVRIPTALNCARSITPVCLEMGLALHLPGSGAPHHGPQSRLHWFPRPQRGQQASGTY